MANPLIELASSVSGTGAQLGSSIQPRVAFGGVQPIQCFLRTRLVNTSGAATATIVLEQSVDNSVWTTNATMGLAGTLSDSKPFCCVVQAPFVRINVTAITGTGAAVSVLMEFVPPMPV